MQYTTMSVMRAHCVVNRLAGLMSRSAATTKMTVEESTIPVTRRNFRALCFISSILRHILLYFANIFAVRFIANGFTSAGSSNLPLLAP